MQWVCSKDVVARSAILGSGGAAVRNSTYKDPRVLAAAKVGPGTTRHFPAIEWTIDNAMGSEPKLPAWVEISNHIIPVELGKLLAGQYGKSRAVHGGHQGAGGQGWPRPSARAEFATVALQQSTGSFKLAFLCIPVFMVPMAIGVWLWVPEHAGKELNEISV